MTEVEDWVYCKCGKKGWEQFADADRVRRKMTATQKAGEAPLTSYECQWRAVGDVLPSWLWHNGHFRVHKRRQ